MVERATRVLHDDRHLGLVRDVPGQPTAVEVVDVPTGARRTLTAPQAGCSPQDLHAGELLWSCQPRASDGRLPPLTGVAQDVATGLVQELAGPAVGELGDSTVAYAAIGRAWARLSVSGYHYGFAEYQRRATGELVDPRRDPPGADELVDLDLPALRRPLCPRVRRPLVPDAFIDYEPGSLEHVGRWYAGTGVDADTGYDVPTRVLLERCDRPRVVLSRVIGDRGSLSDPALTDRWVAWTRTSYGRKASSDVLGVRRLADGATRRIALRQSGRPIAVAGGLLLVDDGRIARVRRVTLGRMGARGSREDGPAPAQPVLDGPRRCCAVPPAPLSGR